MYLKGPVIKVYIAEKVLIWISLELWWWRLKYEGSKISSFVAYVHLYLKDLKKSRVKETKGSPVNAKGSSFSTAESWKGTSLLLLIPACLRSVLLVK